MGWDAGRLPDQTGRHAVVTGANSGLGLEIATRLAAAGAEVTLACRNAEKAAAAIEQIRAVVPDARLAFGSLDLADLSSAAVFAKQYEQGHDRLDLLVNNAGVMAVDQGRTADGFETTFGVNHLGHYALTQHLLPLLLSTNGSRIGTMTSFVHRAGRMKFADLNRDQPYRRWAAYNQSKLANLLFTRGLQRRLSGIGAGTVAVSAHPGATRTHIGLDGGAFTNKVMPAILLLAQPVRNGAAPMLRALTDPEARPGGLYGPRLVYAGPATPERPSARARDERAAEQLWKRSAAFTGLDAFVPAG